MFRLFGVSENCFNIRGYSFIKCKTPTLEICYVKVVFLRLLSHLLHLSRLAAVVVEVPGGHLEARQLRHSLQNHPQRLLVKVHRLLAKKKR